MNTITCNHHKSNYDRTVESGTEFCRVCDLNDRRRDAEGREKELYAELAALRDELELVKGELKESEERAAHLAAITCDDRRGDDGGSTYCEVVRQFEAKLAAAVAERDELAEALRKEKVERFSEFLWRLLDDIDQDREQFEDFREGLERLNVMLAAHDAKASQ